MNNPISEPALVQEDVAASAPSKAKMACQIILFASATVSLANGVLELIFLVVHHI